MNLYEKYQQIQASRIESPSGYNGRVMLIDGMNMYIRCFAATPTMDDDGQHVGGVSGFLLSMGAAVRQWRPSRVIIVFDGPGGSQRRRKLFPDYKGTRRSMTKLNRTYDFATLEDEKKSMVWQLKLLVSLLNKLPVTVLSPDNVEADDVIAYLATTLSDRGNTAIIVSSDKDFLQLVNSNIGVWSPVKKRMYKPESVVEDYGFHPNNFLLYRTVTGDKSDNIPGVEGIGEKTLLKHFPELASEEKRDVNFLFESAQIQIAAKKKPPVVLTKLLESTDQLELNYQLMRLDDVAMSGTTRISVLKVLDSPGNVYNKYELTKLVNSVRLMSVFHDFDAWLMNTFVPLTRFNLSNKEPNDPS